MRINLRLAIHAYDRELVQHYLGDGCQQKRGASAQRKGRSARLMRKLSTIIATLAILATILYAGFVLAIPSVTIHYRLNLVVSVDGQPVTGSGVIEVTREDTTRIFASMGGYGATIKGEAVIVDLGEKGALFALLRGKDIGIAEGNSSPAYILFYAFASQLDKRVDGLAQLRALKAAHAKTDIPFNLIPMLVRFRKIDDPTTIEIVDPENLAASFGPGVSLQRATIEITDDPVTRGITKKLTWLPALEKRAARSMERSSPPTKILKAVLVA